MSTLTANQIVKNFSEHYPFNNQNETVPKGAIEFGVADLVIADIDVTEYKLILQAGVVEYIKSTGVTDVLSSVLEQLPISGNLLLNNVYQILIWKLSQFITRTELHMVTENSRFKSTTEKLYQFSYLSKFDACGVTDDVKKFVLGYDFCMSPYDQLLKLKSPDYRAKEGD